MEVLVEGLEVVVDKMQRVIDEEVVVVTRNLINVHLIHQQGQDDIADDVARGRKDNTIIPEGLLVEVIVPEVFEKLLVEGMLEKAAIENVVQQILNALLAKALEQQVEVETTIMLKTIWANLVVNVVVDVGLGIDISCEGNAKAEETAHEEQKINPEVGRRDESIALEIDCKVNTTSLEVVRDAEQEVEILDHVADLLKVAREVNGIVLEDGSEEEHVVETCNKPSTRKVELVQEALLEKHIFDEVASKISSAKVVLE